MYKYAFLFAICLGIAYCVPDCTTYCNTFMQNCNASNSNNITFYSDLNNCLTVCAAFPVGSDSDTAGNTLGCRIYHAGTPALGNPGLHCPHASSSGGGVCGTYCDAYCSMGRAGCNPSNGFPLEGSDTLWNTGDAGCYNICTTLFPQGAIGNDQSGNTLACRLYHAQVALGSGNTVHCTHASTNGAQTCGSDTCAVYCQQIFTTCPSIYKDNTACMNYCNNNLVPIALGAWDDTGIDSLGCRVYHNGAVPTLGTGHCSHADQAGGDVCGTYCDVYCDLIQKNCQGSNQQYPDTASCMSACALIPATGQDNDAGGDTIQCRIYHAGVAGNPIANAPVHCPHAGKNGAGVCGGTAPTTGATATTGGKSSASSVVASLFLVLAMIAALL